VTADALTYAAVTPARNEAANLRRVASCLARQTQRPAEWVIVDDGSTDETPSIARELAQQVPWVRVVSLENGQPGTEQIRLGRRSGRDVAAFSAGLAALADLPEVVVKLDADVSFEPHYFERLLAEFAADPTLGIASGCAYELENGSWRPRHVTGSRVRGATRAYRRSCLEHVLPLEQRLGWDFVDELQARLRGWKTRSLPGLAFRHHRRMGERDGARRGWVAQGEVAYYCGYRLPYIVLRTLHRCRKEPAAVALLGGFAASALRRHGRHPDPALRALLREEQRLRHLPRRAREATGKR
jgi:glycosyltransferase involved in cell wall biosynthesis